jgi:hypothetical protein
MKARTVAGAVLGIVGTALVAFVDWRLAVGVFLMIWANNVQLDLGNTVTLRDERTEENKE